jgi:small multidrug resistance pump
VGPARDRDRHRGRRDDQPQARDDGKRVWYVAVVAGYLIAFSLLAVALTLGLPIGVAYGIWAATGVALTAILGRVLFREPLTALMLGGIALIIVGVFLVELGH